MADVVFAIEGKPSLSEGDAQALAVLLASDPTPLSIKLAAKINRGLLDGARAEEVELERDELTEIADALSADPLLMTDLPVFKRLYDDVVVELG
jgi:hypothetical protein